MFDNLEKVKKRTNQKVTKDGEVKATVGRRRKNRTDLHVMIERNRKVRLQRYVDEKDTDKSAIINDLLEKFLTKNGY